ncbi:MAG: hypothetical protein ACOX42_01630 [Clostridia bacterium]
MGQFSTGDSVKNSPALTIKPDEELNVAYEQEESLDSAGVRPIELLEPLIDSKIKPIELSEPLLDPKLKPIELLEPNPCEEIKQFDLEKRIREIEPKLHEERTEIP